MQQLSELMTILMQAQTNSGEDTFNYRNPPQFIYRVFVYWALKIATSMATGPLGDFSSRKVTLSFSFTGTLRLLT